MNREHPKLASPFAMVRNDDPTQLNVPAGLLRKAGQEPRAFTVVEAAPAGMSACAGTADRDPTVWAASSSPTSYMPAMDGWRFCRLPHSLEYAAFNQVPILGLGRLYRRRARPHPRRSAASPASMTKAACLGFMVAAHRWVFSTGFSLSWSAFW